MTNFLIIALFIFSSFIFSSGTAFASNLLTYMSESSQGEKQVIVANEDGSHPRSLTVGMRFHLYPRVSSDGSQIVYVEGSDENHLAIVIQNLKTGIIEQWTNESGQNLHPRFSGDGQWLTFSSGSKANHSQIAIINLKEARQKISPKLILVEGVKRFYYEISPTIITSEYNCFFPALSSDASFLVFQRDKGAGLRDVVMLDIKMSTLSQISDMNGMSMSPALSFDDQEIAYTSKMSGFWNIYVYNRLEKSLRTITSGKARNFAPTFTPDGSIAFASDQTGDFQLYKISKNNLGEFKNDGTDFRKILVGNPMHSLYAPSFSGSLDIKQGLLAPMLEPARSSFGSVRVGDRIYVVGGHQGFEHTYPPESFTNRVEYLDLKDQAWHTAAPRIFSAHGFGIASRGKYIYAFGGFAYSTTNNPQWNSLDVIERLDTEKNKWEIIGHMPQGRSSNVVVQVKDKVYLIGGWDSTPRFPKDYEGTFLKSIDVFDLTKEKISISSWTLPDPLRRALTGVASGEDIILMGGISQGADHFSLLKNVTVLHTSTGIWEEWSPLPFGTFAPASAVLNGQVFLFGGFMMTGEDGLYMNHIFSLSPDHKTWFHTGRYLTEAKSFSQVVEIKKGVVAILGGHVGAEDNHPALTCETFKLAH
jgi:hypothetical protein